MFGSDLEWISVRLGGTYSWQKEPLSWCKTNISSFEDRELGHAIFGNSDRKYRYFLDNTDGKPTFAFTHEEDAFQFKLIFG